MKLNYKKLGQYIEAVDLRNTDGKVSYLLGVSIQKKFIPSIANIIGTNLSNYKIVENGQFAYGPVTSRNGDKISIALLKDERCIISSSYTVFKIVNTELLDPEYLMLWFSRPEFDRYARYMSIGSVREMFSWEDMCNVELPVPAIEQQRKIVWMYQTLEERIKLKEAINDNLEKQATVIFNDMFPRINDGENCIGDFIMPQRGRNLLSKNAIKGNVPVIAGGINPTVYHNIANTKEPVLTISASGANAGYVNLWNVPVWSSDSSYIDSTMTDNVYFWYILLKKRQKEIFEAQTGSAQPHIYPQHIALMPMADISKKEMNDFTAIVTPFFKIIGQNKEENTKLSALLDTLLPKLMNGDFDTANRF